MEKQIARDRGSMIVKTSVIAIITNVFLVIFKMAIGLISNSIAIVLDAVNNLTDAISSIVTIVGTKLASRGPDKKHPLGHGRIEYLSALIVSALVIYAGITSLIESIKKIISPVVPEYSAAYLIVVVAAIAVKIILGSFVKKRGEQYNSGALVASGSDALTDAIISASVLLSAVVYLIFGIGLEAYVGVIISLFIIRTGIEMILEALDEILGKRVDSELIREVKKTICEDELVSGAYDLILNNYGPERFIGSVHVEVPDTLTANEIDMLERRIATKVIEKHGILLTGIGIYSINETDNDIRKLRHDVYDAVNQHDGVLQIHGFYADLEEKTMSFDVILDFDLKNRYEIYEEIKRDLDERFPDFKKSVTLDIDIG